MTARAAETTCRSQVSSTQTASADKKLKQKPVVDLSRIGEEELKGISSKGSSQRPRTSTPDDRAHPQVTESEPMEVDTTEVPSASHSSSADTAVRPKTKGASASQIQAQSTAQRQHASPKTKQHTTDQQGVRAMVANVLERQGAEQEDWEQSQGSNYRVEPLRPPTWVVHPPPGQHLAMLEGVSVDECPAEPDITPDELLRWLTVMARGTSQACSYRSQEFQNIQVVKETIQRYEDAQGLQYHKKPVHMDCDLMGPILATFVHHQRELRVARDERQAAWDREVDAKAHRREAENQVAQLNRDLFKSQNAIREAQEQARGHEKAYHEALVRLKRAQTADPAAANQADQVRIQSLETQLNDGNQQLRRLRAERAPNAVDGQMAVQQSETNEQLKALHAENEEAHKALTQVAAERDSAQKAYVQLQMQTLKEKAKLDTESNTLGVRFFQAEAEVMELKEKIGILERRGGYRVSPTTTSATLGPYSHLAFGGMGSGLTAQASPQLGRGMSGLGLPQEPTPPATGRGLSAYLA